MNISNMGGAIEHWLGFQDKIGRSFMMNEDALKYPLADYLVNDGNIDVGTIRLEHQHPNFSSRQVDLAIIDSTTTQINNIFELKLAKRTTRDTSEKHRIFDDLMRLYLASLETTSKCYFIIAGKAIDFQSNFRGFEATEDNFYKKNIFYKKWFAFNSKVAQTITFDVLTEIDQDYQAIYQGFLTEYPKDKYQGKTPLQLPNQITTTCEFVTADSNQIPYMAGIWSIS